MMDELLLVEYARTRSINIRNKLIEKHFPLVRYIVAKMYNDGYAEHEKCDLENFGIFGLIRAIEKFDCKKKNKFTTYAYPKIYYSIIDELRKIDNVPRSVRAKIRIYKKNIDDAENSFGFEFEIDRFQLAKECGLSSKDCSVAEGNYMVCIDNLEDYTYDAREDVHDIFCRKYALTI